ncbi:MAG: Holliday junction branch migration protein RuvA [Candidatus Levybacteria bacterium]|nr:Holliday junction branch migration protein RuvA [Candidatus Levybacteria bacterium]
MIGFLKGEVFLREGNSIILDVKGVGYKVLAASDVLARANKGVSLELFIYTHVREDNISLFGFLESLDLKLFENLIGISGIGPKTAMAIFSTGTRNTITNAIIKGDVDFFTSVPRLGHKNAQKIIIELKNKFGGDGEIDLLGYDSKDNKEIISGLESFGFSKKEAINAIREIDKKDGSVEEKIRLALKFLGR